MSKLGSDFNEQFTGQEMFEKGRKYERERIAHTPHSEVEGLVEQCVQSILDMYFLAGARISVETWKNTKDFVRNALTIYGDAREAAVRKKEKTRHDWLREEIGRLEEIQSNIDNFDYDSDERGKREILTTIITWYKEELKELESK